MDMSFGVNFNINSLQDVDVLVAGGGPAGIGAGLAATRAGARTMIVERWGFLGGLATAGLFTTLPVDRGMGKQDYSGLLSEILERLRNCDAVEMNTAATDMLYNDDVLKGILVKMAAEAGLCVLYHSYVTGALVKNGQMHGVTIVNKRGETTILAKVVIDCTGDGDVAVSAGAPYEDCPVVPLPKISLFFRLGGVESKILKRRQELAEVCNRVKSYESYSRLEYKPFIVFAPALRPHEKSTIVGSAAIFGFNGLDPFDLSECERLLRQYILDCLLELRKALPEFGDAYLAATPPAISVESTRRIIGEYILTADDVRQCRFFHDTIAVSSPKGIHATYFKALTPDKRRGHGIPYRTLLPLKVENLLLAGRCFSSTHDAHDGHPYIPTCVLMGQAAGTAAAMAVQKDCSPRVLDPSNIRSELRKQGVYLGQDAT